MAKLLTDLQYQLAQCGCFPIVGENPDLNKYFELVLTQLRKAPESLDSRLESIQEPETPKKREEFDQILKDRISSIAADIFTRRDANRDGVFSKEESDLFFTAYMMEYKKFALEIAELTSQNTTLPPPMPKIEHILSNDPEAIEEAARQDIENTREVSRESADIKWNRYLENEASMNAAAFAVMDKNNNGELEKDEVVAALVPGTPENLEFLRALGMLTWGDLSTVQQFESYRMSGRKLQQQQCTFQ